MTGIKDTVQKYAYIFKKKMQYQLIFCDHYEI